jgi:hypothetical protein
MFAPSFFANVYFAPTYFPGGGTSVSTGYLALKFLTGPDIGKFTLLQTV